MRLKKLYTLERARKMMHPSVSRENEYLRRMRHGKGIALVSAKQDRKGGKYMLRRLATLFCFAALVWMIPARADQWDKKTIVTFSRSIELPGIVLPAGTYVFKLLDTPGNRHVVQVFSKDEMHLFTTVLAIPNHRLTPTSDSVMRFNEAKKNNPEAMRAWFYPADNFGQEFVYPRKRAGELAASAQIPVLTAEVKPAETPEELVQEPVVEVTPENKEIPIPVTQAPVVAQATPAQVAAPAPAELPKTASPLPLLALVGAGSLFLAVGLRKLARRIA